MRWQGVRVHLVGISGAGMSAIAKVLLERGARVSGSDLKRSGAATLLEAMGAEVHLGHDAGLVEDVDLVIASSAIPDHNPELRRARERGVEILTRGHALAQVLEGARSIVVAGTHGKTTTTSMIVSTLRANGLDPTYLVGAGLNDAGTNAKHGLDDLAVAESDESDGSFLLLEPWVAVVTNVEADHLDHWGSLEEIRDAFGRFLSAGGRRGAVVVPGDDEDLVARATASGRSITTFGSSGQVSAEEVALEALGSRFVLTTPAGRADASLRVPGGHNVANALAAAAACLHVGLTPEQIAHGLGTYRGVDRRFHLRGRRAGVSVIDDYAHHPTEVRATLAAARTGEWRRVVAVFQPHRFSRTAAFSDQFGAAFGDADRIVITDVYGAGEEPVPGISGKLVADAVCRRLPGRPVAYLPHRGELIDYLAVIARPGDAVVTMGAGDVTAVADELLDRWGQRG